MMKRLLTLLVAAASILFVPACGGDKKDAKSAGSEPVERVKGVDETIALFKQKHPSIEKLFSSSAGYVVFPSIGEGAFIIGGGGGNGEAFEGGTYVGHVSIHEITVGAQVGGQSYSQVVFFETPVDFKRLKDNSFQFGAEVTAVAADAAAAKNAEFKDGVIAFIIPRKGLMASASVGGQKLDYTAAK
jgi:lipid-binding SYLF domain-containing protein